MVWELTVGVRGWSGMEEGKGGKIGTTVIEKTREKNVTESYTFSFHIIRIKIKSGKLYS